jgi:REP element-mobilizing transposase RayT
MKQLDLINPKSKILEHGGTQSIGKRKSQRPLSTKRPVHLVLKSNIAVGHRSLMRHRPLIEKVITRSRKRFGIKVYEFAIVSNHIHFLVRGFSRLALQNFFRVVAGHIAQEILRAHPLSNAEQQEAGGAPKNRKHNRFWISRIYSRIVTWGREFQAVKKYVIQNTLEALKLIVFKTRKRKIIRNFKLKSTS